MPPGLGKQSSPRSEDGSTDGQSSRKQRRAQRKADYKRTKDDQVVCGLEEKEKDTEQEDLKKVLQPRGKDEEERGHVHSVDSGDRCGFITPARGGGRILVHRSQMQENLKVGDAVLSKRAYDEKK